MKERVVFSGAAGLVVITGLTWGMTRADGSTSPAHDVVVVHRGDITRTVGGVGHVATLRDAARLAVPVSDPAGGSSSSSSAGAGSTAEAVFAGGTGHVLSLVVDVGAEVTPGQVLAHITDDGSAQTAVVLASSELAAARLDLAKLRVQDPARGLPPTAAELQHAKQSILSARDALARVTGSPLASDLAGAKLDVAQALVALKLEQTARTNRPAVVAGARDAVEAATERLAQLTGRPDAAELAAAQLEVARAQVEQETLLRSPASPAASEVAAADAAVAAAQEKVSTAQAGGIAADIALAQAELSRARADREALTRAAEAPTAAAQSAARIAVEAAQRKLDALVHPSRAAVSAARSELATAQADLVAARDDDAASRLAAARSAVAAAEARLELVRNPAPETVSSARTEAARAQADLAVLRQRGAPATATDLAIAELRVTAAEEQLNLARTLMERLSVRATGGGTVTSILTAEGAAVDATTPLMRVQDLDDLAVTVNLTEFDVGKTAVGAPTRISADGLGGKAYAGEVADVALSGDTTGGVVTFPVIVAVTDPEGLRPGMSVSVRIVVAAATDVLRIPVDAIEDRDGRDATVVVRTRSGKTSDRSVRLGLVGASYAEVRSGLAAGDKVVVATDEE